MPIAKRGDRVRITGVLPDDPHPLPIGQEGTVINVMNASTSLEQIHVDWDGLSTRIMLLRTDPFEVIPPKRRSRGTLVSHPE
ncbi:hypothetical protein HOT31_gp113 [Microbacterium phage Hendrix]|uniref:DUF4314 domain-containing protein n=1 Tax=Microbacterium phage Hendrix TaxID=2182341 RepID=A0A2U8UUD1_9CAUD|nr:hypothetical protein HOT31_gp113 [Microbacterium phage Hendrix]AWN07784.1 hypothetical protein PBI_HENDRIX_113 [Microbacterium phage Hendrix]